MVSALRKTSGSTTALPRLSTAPPWSQRGQRARQPAEVAMAGGAERGAVGGGMLVDDLRADRRVHGHRHVVSRARPAGPTPRAPGSAARAASARASPSPIPWSARAAAAMAAFISAPVSSAMPKLPSARPLSTSSLVPPNAASSKSWIAAAPFSARWVTMPRASQRPQQRAQPDLDHVAARRAGPRPAARAAAGHAGDDRAQVPGGEHVGQAVEEGGEGAVGAGRRGEEGGIDLVAPRRRRGRCVTRLEVGLAVGHAQRLGLAVVRRGSTISFSRSVMVPKGNLLRICTGSRRASSVSQMPGVGPLGEHPLGVDHRMEHQAVHLACRRAAPSSPA